MNNPRRRTVSLLVLIAFFVMSVGAYGFNSKWFDHEIDHAQHSIDLQGDHSHEFKRVAQGDPAPEPMSDVEHKLLHAYCHAEHYVAPILYDLPEPAIQATPVWPYLLTRLLPTPESPFRPPRITLQS